MQKTLFKLLPEPVQVLPYFGNKWAQAGWHRQIIEYYFYNRIQEFREPYAGSASTFFNRQPVAVEGLNDKNPSTVNAFKVIQQMPQQLLKQLNKLPIQPTKEELRILWNLAKECETAETCDKVFWAAAFLWCAHYQENGGGGRWCHGLSRQIGTRYWHPPDWPRIIEFAHARLEGVQITQGDALEYMAKHDGVGVLFYVDPPYMHESDRGSKDKRHINGKSRRQYCFEMSWDDHKLLLDLLNGLKAGVMLSGYDSALYEAELTPQRGWTKHCCPSGYSPDERIWAKI